MVVVVVVELMLMELFFEESESSETDVAKTADNVF